MIDLGPLRRHYRAALQFSGGKESVNNQMMARDAVVDEFGGARLPFAKFPRNADNEIN